MNPCILKIETNFSVDGIFRGRSNGHSVTGNYKVSKVVSTVYSLMSLGYL